MGRNKWTYLQIGGKPMDSTEFMKQTKSRINKRVVDKTRLASQEIIAAIEDILEQLVDKHPEPRYSVWRKYYVTKSRLYTKNGKDGLKSAKINIYVVSKWPKFNLWEVYDRGGFITFRENATWPVLTNNMIPRDAPDTPFRVLEADYMRGKKGFIRYRKRGPVIKDADGQPTNILIKPVTDFYERRWMFRRVLALVAPKKLQLRSRKVENNVVRYTSSSSLVEFRVKPGKRRESTSR